MVRKKGIFPGNDEKVVAGCDPYDHDTTTDGRRSNAASYVFRKFTMGDGDSNTFVSEYINRPPKADIFYEDILKQCVFYGCQVLVENNKIGLIKYFQNRGYENYLMERPENTHTDYSRKQKTPGIPTTGAAVINAMADAIQAYIYDNVGINPLTNEIGNCFFKDLLLDWSQFDIENRTKYDATIASGMALLAAQKNYKIKVKRKTLPFVKEYNNKGTVSRLIKI